MSKDQINKVLAALPQSNMTTRLLGALDYIVPGEWVNVTDFEDMIRRVTGETDQDLIQKVGERAIALYKDPDTGYQRARQIFDVVDDVGGLAGFAVMARKIGESFGSLDFLTEITPKADTTFAIDAGAKLVAELGAFCYCNGLPGDSVSDFAAALASYEKEDAIRLAAWIVCDCLIPLGPEALSKIVGLVEQASDDELSGHGRFSRVMALMPGSDVAAQRDLLKNNMGAASTAVSDFVSSKGIEREGALAKIQEYLQIAEDKLQYLAAGIDLTTNYFEHTGTQTVARRVIARAYAEI